MTRRDVVGGDRLDLRDDLVERRDLALVSSAAAEAAHAARRGLQRHRQRAGEVALGAVELAVGDAAVGDEPVELAATTSSVSVDPLGRGAA